MDGIINIFKEKGFTSHDVVAVVRRTLGQKKVGHTGTLDPMAEGVLPVCVGKGTKIADYIMAAKKGYRTVLTLGVTTDTQDSTGTILETRPVDFQEEKITQVIKTFLGKQEQVPPMYSAIKVEGKKLYELARKGVTIERKPRNIELFDIQIRNFLPPNQLELDIVCSKGTYIRSLCADIGEKLGCGGHMASLLRTMSGNFRVEQSISLEKLKELAQAQKLEQVLLPLEEALSTWNRVYVNTKITKLLYNGGKIYDSFFQSVLRPIVIGEKLLGYDSNGQLVGLYEATWDSEKDKILIRPFKILL